MGKGLPLEWLCCYYAASAKDKLWDGKKGKRKSKGNGCPSFSLLALPNYLQRHLITKKNFPPLSFFEQGPQVSLYCRF